MGVEPLESRALLAAAPTATIQLLKDTATAGASSQPLGLATAGSNAYFSAYVGSFETETPDLWKSDGTADGTVKVYDVSPEAVNYDADISESLGIGNSVYFVVRQVPRNMGGGNDYADLYISNGTAATTTRLGRFTEVGELTNVNSTLYFRGVNTTGTAGLWKSGGTVATTALVKAFDTTAVSLEQFTAVSSQLFFVARPLDGVGGDALWKSGGLASNTTVAQQFGADGFGDIPTLTEVNGTLYFVAYDFDHGEELWKSTSAGVVSVLDLLPGADSSNPGDLNNFNGALYFRAHNDTSTYDTLFRTTGTVAGTSLVLDLGATTHHGYADTWHLTDLNGTAYFLADDGESGTELWKTDGTTAGTARVTTLASTTTNYFSDWLLTKAGSTLFFPFDDGIHGMEVWRTDGTAAGTVVLDVVSGAAGSNPSELIDLQGTLLFQADDGAHGAELWKSNGTLAGTTMVKDINQTTQDGIAYEFASTGTTTLFPSHDSALGDVLWKTDGTPGGTSVLKDIQPSASGGSLSNLRQVGNSVYFTADDGATGAELWISDGTTEGTHLLRDICPGAQGSWPTELTDSGGTLYFVGQDGSSGRQVWLSNGTMWGTERLTTFTPGDMGPMGLTDVGGTLYFTSDFHRAGGGTGYGLWQSMGSSTSTVLLKEFTTSSMIDSVANVGGTLYFRVLTPAENKRELWKSDGTATGTVLVKDLGQVAGTTYDGSWVFASLGGAAYFLATDPSTGIELWKTDGSSAGTTQVKTFTAAGANETFLTAANGALYFRADDGVSGQELWKSNGTSAGTQLVADLASGTRSSYPAELTVAGGMLLFRADGTSSGDLWMSDGTAAGTFLVRTRYSVPLYCATGLTAIDGMLFLTADDKSHGMEPWLVNMNELRAVSAALNGQNTLAVTYEVVGGPVAPFELGVYRSADTAFSNTDALTGAVRIDAAADRTAGSHTKTFTIGSGIGQISLPGAGAAETEFEYYLLAVVDHLGVVPETAASTLYADTNNVTSLSGAYHVAGGPVMVHGTSAADVLQVLPAAGGMQVHLGGTAFSYAGTDVSGLRARGHLGDDQLEFTWNAGYGAPAGTTLDFRFIGGGGGNTAKLYGSNTSTLDTANLNPTYTTITGPGYYILAKDLKNSTFYGQGGADKAYLYDSSGDDTLRVYPTYATLANSTATFANRVENCPNVYGNGISTGTDTAHFYAGTGNGRDLFSGSPAYATMTGSTGTGRNYYSRSDGFEVLVGDSSDGINDVATLFDSELTTTNTQYAFTLDAGQKYGLIQNGSAASIRANGFYTTVTGTRDQGADSATLHGSSGADTIQAKMYAKEVWLVPTTGTAFKYRASQVQHVEAHSTDKLDTAEFTDSAGSDTFTAGPDSAQMTTPSGVSVSAANFRYVNASSTRGGIDTAVLTGKTGTRDYFVGQPTQATLGDSSTGTGSSYFDWVQGFESVVASGLAADLDTATFSGSDAADTFTSDFYLTGAARDPNRPYATFAGTGFSNTANGFRYVTATGAASDVAHLYAAASGHTFSATPTSSVMYSTSFYHEAKKFGTVHAHGLGTTGALAKLNDAALHVLLESSGTTAKLSNLDSTNGPFAVWVENFLSATATAAAANTFAKKNFATAPSWLTLTGPWTNL